MKHANTTKNTTSSVEAIVVIKSKSKTALFLILCQYGQTEKPEGALVFCFVLFFFYHSGVSFMLLSHLSPQSEMFVV